MNAKDKSISDKLIYFSIIILTAHFIARMIDHAKIISTFPLDASNDISCYLAFLHWFHIYGFHGFVPNWFHGIILFDVYPPGWVFFVYPIYLLTKNVLVTAYISLILQFTLGGIIFYFLGRMMKLPLLKTVAFFCLFFMSPMAIGDFIKQGRLPEMLAWLFFILLCTIILYFKDKEIDWSFMWVAPLFAGLILTHQAETILMGIVALGLLLTRKKLKELFIMFLAFGTGTALSSFWLVSFLKEHS